MEIIELIILIVILIILYKDRKRDERIDDMECDLRILTGKKWK